MSRGGGFRGGGGKRRPPGAELSWQSEGGRDADTGPTPLFPKYLIPKAQPLSQIEREQVEHYRRWREKIHNGPHYAVLGGSQAARQQGVPVRAQFDPFQGMASYGQRYVRKTRTLPNLRTRSYETQLFPEQLRSTISTNYTGLGGTGANGTGGVSRKRGFEDDEDADVDEERKKQRSNAGGEEEGSDAESERLRRDEEDVLDDEEEEEGEEEIVDDDFEEDEEDMGGDYNAEQYFDGGDEDGDYDGGGGGEDFDTF